MSAAMKQRLAAAQHCIPGGVNSPVRAFGYVGGEPVFMERGKGACLYDADGRAYLDYVCSWGAMITGHADPRIVARVQEQAAKGLGFGTLTELETRMAERIRALMPNIEKLRMVNSGTEAAMSAIRLARGYTGRDRLLKFDGCYHGHADSLLVQAGSGVLTLGIPGSPGIPEALTRLTVSLPYNDLDTLGRAFQKYGPEIAAVIVEPVAGNMGCILPRPGFLEGIRALCDRHGSLLIFDEVMTGFRVAAGGAQETYGIRPDLTALGKVIGGGLPVGAFGGRAEIMDRLAPEGPVYQAGTLSGNPVAMAAGLAALEQVGAPEFHLRLAQTARRLSEGLAEAAAAAGVPLVSCHAGGMFGFFFSKEREVADYRQAGACDRDAFRRFFRSMLEQGVYLAPSPFEAGFVSSAHGAEEVARTLEAAGRAFEGCNMPARK